MSNNYKIALNFLTKQQEKARIALDHAKKKNNVRQSEIENLEKKKRAIDYCIVSLVENENRKVQR